MTFRIVAAAMLACVVMGSTAWAQSADDKKWVNQCLTDNKDATVSVDIVRKYCTCMNDKMSDNETRSITQWEKANPAARVACDRESGWR